MRFFLATAGVLLALLGAWASWLLATRPLPDDQRAFALAPLSLLIGALMLFVALRSSGQKVVLEREGFWATKAMWTRRVLWRDVETLELFFARFWSGVAWKTRTGHVGGTPVGLELPAAQVLDLMERFRRRAVASKATLEGR